MNPIIPFTNIDLHLSRFCELSNILWFLFLGIGASVACFITWNYAVEKINPVRSSIYIYMLPVINTIVAVFILDESITPITLIGMGLILFGLILSSKINDNITK